MWYAIKGNWDQAHLIVQDISSNEASWIHAHLHRDEGDMGNAKYWYNRAQKDSSHLSLDDEAEKIIKYLIS